MKRYIGLFYVLMGGVVIGSEPEVKSEDSSVRSSLETGMITLESNPTEIKEEVIRVSMTAAEIKAEKDLMQKAEQARLQKEKDDLEEEINTLLWMQ